MILWGALQVDLSRRRQSEEERQAADDLVSLLTPVIKGYLTDKGFEAAVDAQQVFGGHGYIREHGMEQFVRDARIAQIYEGTNGIQAMDLVGRKLRQGRRPRGARLVRAARRATFADAEGGRRSGWLGELCEPALGDLAGRDHVAGAERHGRPRQCRRRRLCLHGADGPRRLGWMWLKMAAASTRALESGAGDRAFHEAKLVTARFFAERELPLAAALRRKVEAGAETLMKLPEEAF